MDLTFERKGVQSQADMKNVFLTGGTGFVGQRVFKYLVDKGYRVRCLLRKGSDESKLPGAEIVYGNVWEPESYKGALKGMDGVIHLVGIIQERKLRGNTFEKVHCKGTRSLALEAKEAGIKKFVHMSALGTRPDAASAYHRTKYRAEVSVRHGWIPFTVFRPSIIFGEPPCPFLETLTGLAKAPVFTPIIGAGSGKLQPVYVGDVARCFEAALLDEKTDERTFELGGSKSYTFLELMGLIESRLGKKKMKMHIPVSLMKAAALGMDFAPFPMPLSRDQMILLKEDNVCDPSVMEKNFNFKPVDFEAWLKQAPLSR